MRSTEANTSKTASVARSRLTRYAKRVNLREQFDSITALQDVGIRLDTWTSALSGIGHSTYDKRLDATFTADLVSRAEALEMWAGDDLAFRIIEMKVDDMFREGYRFVPNVEENKRRKQAGKKSRLDAVDMDLQKEIHDDYERLGASFALGRGKKFERALGGGAVIIGIDDGRKPDEPVGQNIREVTYLNALEPEEIRPLWYYGDPLSPKYGQVEIYEVLPSNVGQTRDEITPTPSEIHETRVLVFPGVRTTNQNTSRHASNGWGASVLTRVRSVLRDYNMSWAAFSIMMHDFSQPVFRMQGLAEAIAGDQNDIFKNRMKAIGLARSVLRMIILDAGGGEDGTPPEEFSRVQTPLAGLPDMFDRATIRVAAAAEMPVTRLFGRSPAGQNATGEGDDRAYYDLVRSDQTKQILPHLKKLTRYLLAAKGNAITDWTIEFNPLWQDSNKEIAETRTANAQGDALMIDRGVVTPDEVAKSRYGGDRYGMDLRVDFASRKSFEDREVELEQREFERQKELAVKSANNGE